MKPALEPGQTCTIQGIEVVAVQRTRDNPCEGCINENDALTVNSCNAAGVPSCTNESGDVITIYMPIDQYMIRRMKGEL